MALAELRKLSVSLSLKVKLCHLPNFICFDERFFLLLRYLNFCPDFFGHVGKWLDKKTKVNFKIYIIY